MYEDEQLDLPRQPGPDAVSIEELRWHTTPGASRADHLAAVRVQPAAIRRLDPARGNWNKGAKAGGRGSGHAGAEAKTGIYADPHAYFVEVHRWTAMPWFMGPVGGWYARLGQPGQPLGADGGKACAMLEWARPESGWSSTSAVVSRIAALTDARRRPACASSLRRRTAGVLFGTATVTLMLTADARIHEILQISADRFVKPVRVYVVKNPDGTPKRDPATNRIVTDVIVEQRLLPKGRKRTTSGCSTTSARRAIHLQEMTRLLKAAHGGQIPTSRMTRSTRKPSNSAPSGICFSGTDAHLVATVNNLIRLVLDEVVLVGSVWRADRRDQPSAASRRGDRAAATVRRAAGGPGRGDGPYARHRRTGARGHPLLQPDDRDAESRDPTRHDRGHRRRCQTCRARDRARGGGQADRTANGGS